MEEEDLLKLRFTKVEELDSYYYTRAANRRCSFKTNRNTEVPSDGWYAECRESDLEAMGVNSLSMQYFKKHPPAKYSSYVELKNFLFLLQFF